MSENPTSPAPPAPTDGPSPTNPAPEDGPIVAADDDRIASSSTSLASSILQHRIENGRTYHKCKDGKYPFPNDEKESDRLDLQHNIYLLTLNYKLGLAPPNENLKAQRVLDLGTGTGLWAIDFGDEHPEAEVVGVDLTPVPTAFVPPNVKFEVDDFEEPWTYSQPFDYIYIRGLSGSVADWGKFFKKAYDHLTPGGYIELFEGHMRPDCDDGTLTSESALMRWVDKVEEASKIFGRPYRRSRPVKYKWPVSPWPKDPYYKELGEWCLENFMEGLEAWSLGAFTRALNWTKEEVQVRNELKDRRIHAYSPLWVIYARRPIEKEE
ncbi:S-adenosyl-L-methionine-dependent methyltransferase [Colletotrichum phormii]|uniref:S-adenosyl-L-methionine-dependent methyltransferase n=1 Tax=Colletotrichum phormii TaxID=359342 RepID=A0AAJ0EGS8_9PEZI|nr:S-adenosyl-L-methionine-dependent methyltransferase [Colletotrichum phormii]KAK1638304.1 S-adenosyl-L-methionine-dependent methyltransferase [Colletotrichum phormii]